MKAADLIIGAIHLRSFLRNDDDDEPEWKWSWILRKDEKIWNWGAEPLVLINLAAGELEFLFKLHIPWKYEREFMTMMIEEWNGWQIASIFASFHLISHFCLTPLSSLYSDQLVSHYVLDASVSNIPCAFWHLKIFGSFRIYSSHIFGNFTMTSIINFFVHSNLFQPLSSI